jgi:branched-chain amino acid transport system permease protein
MSSLTWSWWQRGLRLPLALLGLGVALPLTLGADAYGWRVLTIAATYALATMGYQLLFGRLGVLSLAQGAFFGLGAYATAILATRWGLSFPLTFAAAIMIPAAFAAVIAVPVLRLETHYFALATLGLSQVLLLAATNWISLTGGANGIAAVPAPLIFGWRVTPGMALALFAWGLVAIAAWLGTRALSSLYGATLTAIREIPLAAAAIGIDPAPARFAGLVASAALGGAAGAVHAHAVGVVSPEVLELPVMVACLSMAVVGGRGSLAGAVLGAVLLIHLPEWFRFLERYGLFAYGAALLATILLAPEGIIGLLARTRAWIWPEPPPPLPTARALPVESRPVAGAALLDAQGLTKRYGGVVALDSVSLRLAAGEIIGLIGANGSGKTTLLNVLSGLARPEAGRVSLAGQDVTGWVPHRLATA